MKLRDALQHQAPSLALQRATADEVARLDGLLFAAYRLIKRLRCQKAPPGWFCTRAADHDGPCAAEED